VQASVARNDDKYTADQNQPQTGTHQPDTGAESDGLISPHNRCSDCKLPSNDFAPQIDEHDRPKQVHIMPASCKLAISAMDSPHLPQTDSMSGCTRQHFNMHLYYIARVQAFLLQRGVIRHPDAASSQCSASTSKRHAVENCMLIVLLLFAWASNYTQPDLGTLLYTA
jgi:hypothetical protein